MYRHEQTLYFHIMAYSMERSGSMHHQVRRGDSLSGIGRRYGVSVIILLNLNPHLRRRRHRIHVGERVRVR